MIVTCEACHTKFRLDPDRLKGSKSKVRCSRCGNIFMVIQEEENFFDIDLGDDRDLAAKDSIGPPPMLTSTGPSRVQKSPVRTRLLIWLALVLALSAGMLGIFSYLGSRSQEKLPPISAETASVRVLDTTHAFFLENAHTGQVFVVEGEVENQSAKPISFVLVEGKLFNTTNRVAITQRCYVGNAMSHEELGRMNITEIQNRMMNREGKSLSNVKIPPGKRVPFMLVFHNLPELKALSDYSVEVISSKLD
jgi:predicted Zn finger-like uncharacterized protein